MSKKLLATLENSKQYTMAVAAAMPEKEYSFKPADEVMGFGELLNHIAYGIDWWHDNYVKGNKTDWAPPATGNSRKEATANLEKAYATLGKTLNNGSLSEDAVTGFYATLDHITHHRGQAITYLRCKGLTPPEYMY